MACHSQILYPNVDSNHFTIPDAEDYTPAQMVKHIIEDKCPGYSSEIVETKCRSIDPRGPIDSKVCVVYTNVGYFYTMKDIMGAAHIVFSRWD